MNKAKTAKKRQLVAPMKNRIIPRPREAKATTVYVAARADGLVKIGISRNPKRRMSGIQSATPDRLELVCVVKPRTMAAFDLEARAMMALARWRVSGEWFKCRPIIAKMTIEAIHRGEDRFIRFLNTHWWIEAAWDEFQRLEQKRLTKRPREPIERENLVEDSNAAEEEWQIAKENAEKQFPDLMDIVYPPFFRIGPARNGPIWDKELSR